MSAYVFILVGLASAAAEPFYTYSQDLLCATLFDHSLTGHKIAAGA